VHEPTSQNDREVAKESLKIESASMWRGNLEVAFVALKITAKQAL
jgi:hypothetical protein